MERETLMRVRMHRASSLREEEIIINQDSNGLTDLTTTHDVSTHDVSGREVGNPLLSWVGWLVGWIDLYTGPILPVLIIGYSHERRRFDGCDATGILRDVIRVMQQLSKQCGGCRWHICNSHGHRQLPWHRKVYAYQGGRDALKSPFSFELEDVIAALHRENMTSAKLPRLGISSRGNFPNFSLTPNWPGYPQLGCYQYHQPIVLGSLWWRLWSTAVN